jgi:hypothetical protein
MAQVYDFDDDQRVAFVERPSWMSAAIVLCPCRLRWEDESTLMVAWADSVKVVRIKERDTANINSNKEVRDAGRRKGEPKQNQIQLRPKYAEILIWFRTDVFVCGIVPFGPDRIALLGYPMCDDDDDNHNDDQSAAIANGADKSKLRRQNSSTRELAQEWANDTMMYSTDLSHHSSTVARLLAPPLENTSDNSSGGGVEVNAANGNDVVAGEGLMRVVRGQHAELRILTRTDGADVSSETLPLRGFERNQVRR